MKVADAHYCFRMDMVLNAGKSRKNVDDFVFLSFDARQAVDLLIVTRTQVGVPPSNIYLHIRTTERRLANGWPRGTAVVSSGMWRAKVS